MNYYLSYVEMRGHGALVLSTQEFPPNGPSNVTYEVGLSPGKEFKKGNILSKIFGKWRGVLKEDPVSSLALYSSSSPIMHRTYQISKEEAEKFFQIVNRDRRKNVKDEEPMRDAQNKLISSVGGDDYRYIGYNCKAYALEVFKELGIIETKKIGNFFIQMPHTKQKMLQKITEKEMQCQLKDDFISSTGSLLTDLMKVLEKIEKDLALFNELKENDENFIKKFSIIRENAKKSVTNLKKAGLSKDFDLPFSLLIENLNELNLPQSSSHPLLAEANHIISKSHELQEMHEDIMKGYKQNSLVFNWKKAPPLTQRKTFNNFTDVEKALYLIDVRAREMEATFDNLLWLIKKQNEIDPVSNKNSDLAMLKTLIEESKKELDDCNDKYKKYPRHDGIDQLEKYQKKYIELNSIMQKFETKVSTHEFKDRPETNLLKKFIRKMINYFKKDYQIIASDPKSVIESQIKKVNKEKNKREGKYDNPMSIMSKSMREKNQSFVQKESKENQSTHIKQKPLRKNK